MEGLHNVEYSFPSPDELINSVPKIEETESEILQREADRLLDEKVQKAGEGGLNNLFQTLSHDLSNLDIALNWPYNYSINATNNMREFVDNKEPFHLIFIITHKNIFKEKAGKTNISISFGDEIEITYSSDVTGYSKIPEQTIKILSMLDIRTILNSLLIITPESTI